MGPSADLVEIYRVSVLRTLPYFLWFTGPYALVADVLGDVLFYLQPSGRTAIRQTCENRLRAALEYARGGAADASIVVLAHSQGSVIAGNMKLRGNMSADLVTIGSPFDSLYGRFLGVQYRTVPVSNWTNAFRSEDVIGGPIHLLPATDNVSLGPGGHMGYWDDPRVAATLRRILNIRTRETATASVA